MTFLLQKQDINTYFFSFGKLSRGTQELREGQFHRYRLYQSAQPKPPPRPALNLTLPECRGTLCADTQRLPGCIFPALTRLHLSSSSLASHQAAGCTKLGLSSALLLSSALCIPASCLQTENNTSPFSPERFPIPHCVSVEVFILITIRIVCFFFFFFNPQGIT